MKCQSVADTGVEQPVIIASQASVFVRRNKRQKPEVIVHSAAEADACRMAELINAWAGHGLTLERQEAQVLSSIGEYVVAERENRVIGCGALIAYSPSLAEIRSIAVDDAAQGLGVGRRIVSYLIDEAEQFEIDQLILVTKTPGFFAKLGFRELARDDLPETFVHMALLPYGRTLCGRTVMSRQSFDAVL